MLFRLLRGDRRLASVKSPGQVIIDNGQFPGAPPNPEAEQAHDYRASQKDKHIIYGMHGYGFLSSLDPAWSAAWGLVFIVVAIRG